MKNYRIIFFYSIMLSFLNVTGQGLLLTDRVNPFIGTGGHGHTYPGVSMPFGMIQLSPDTRLDGWDACSGYHASDSVIYGFSHTHLSGTGCADYCDILVLPVTGHVSLENYNMASAFKKFTEIASPGYYRVNLDKYHIQAELTATQRVGFHRYTFPASVNAGITIDLKHRDIVLESSLKIVGPDEIEGMRISKGWAEKQILYFVAKFSKPFESYTVSNDSKLSSDQKEFAGKNIKACFTFSTRQGEKILMKVGLSAVSADGARKNMEQEIPDWDFNGIVNNAALTWNSELGKIIAEGGTRNQQIVFYTALYHSMLNPNIYMDVDGTYRGRDLRIHQAKGFDYYTVFSLWDTYRATHPLFTIIDEKRTNDFINTFIHQYMEGGMLPVWELSGNETGCMIGYHAVSVMADAYLKGIRAYDTAKAFEAMKHSADQEHLGLKYFNNNGFIPGDKEGESVSKTLEYAYDDWCIARMAKEMGRHDDYRKYIQRAQYYKNIFDESTGFMRAKMNETWFRPFDPAEVNFNYTEANAWQYGFYVPQDITGLMELTGGKEKFSQKLDDLFSADVKISGRDQADISGQIGQYAHGNEPSHHMAYLYDYAGYPWKTQAMAHRIMTTLYTNSKDGLCGNEDCGQMSSWYVLSAMGFYPVTPGSDVYAIGSPLFPKVTINLENGKKFVITAKNVSNRNIYIQSATLNGTDYRKSFIRHTDVINGGELAFSMGPEPNKQWGSKEGDIPVSAISDWLITPVPSVNNGHMTFPDSTMVTLSCPVRGAVIFYTLNGKQPTESSGIYKKPLIIRNTTNLRAFAEIPHLIKSFEISAIFTKIPKNRKITLNTKYAPQYSGGGDLALIDYVRGSDNFRTGAWQGYEGVDLDAIIDLGKTGEIHKISTGFLQDEGSWIFFPLRVDYFVSANGKDYSKAMTVPNDIPEKKEGPLTKEFSMTMKGEKVRFIRVVAKNRGICPAWHPGAGEKAWIFADEISIE